MVIFSTYVRRSLPFVSRFTSILMLEGNQLRLLNIISLLSVYLSQLVCYIFHDINISIYSLIFVIEHAYVLYISETLLDGGKTTIYQ